MKRAHAAAAVPAAAAADDAATARLPWLPPAVTRTLLVGGAFYRQLIWVRKEVATSIGEAATHARSRSIATHVILDASEALHLLSCADCSSATSPRNALVRCHQLSHRHYPAVSPTLPSLSLACPCSLRPSPLRYLLVHYRSRCRFCLPPSPPTPSSPSTVFVR